MSDAKRYTSEDLAEFGYDSSGFFMTESGDGLDLYRVEATVRALDAAQAEVAALRAEAKERQRVLEQAIEERASAFSERNWANERHEEAVSEVTALRARVEELRLVARSSEAWARGLKQDRDAAEASVVDLRSERDEWKARATEAAASAERMRESLTGLEDACAAVASWSEECLDYSDAVRVAARAALSTPAPAWLRERDRALVLKAAERIAVACMVGAGLTVARAREALPTLDLAAIVAEVVT